MYEKIIDMEIKRYYSFNDFSLKNYGEKIYKIALNLNFGCPNRDGKVSTGGCIFCANGSGDFASLYQGEKIQLKKTDKQSDDALYIGYFQAYTNTYADINTLRFYFTKALEDDLLAGISIATRPDCMGEDVLNLLKELKDSFPDKFIWVELGLQTISEKNAKWMNRGYPTPVFDKCVKDLHRKQIPVIVHVILGLPNEDEAFLIEEMKYLNALHIDGIKLQLLHILQGTKLYDCYQNNEIQALTEEDYVSKVCLCISYLDENIVIHRLTGDGERNKLVAPLWSLHKRHVLNSIAKYLKANQITQGCKL